MTKDEIIGKGREMKDKELKIANLRQRAMNALLDAYMPSLDDYQELKYVLYEYDEALREMLAQPEQEPVAWIKCSERLPQNKRAVLVFAPSNRCIFCAYWDTDQWLYFGGYPPQPISHPVTHWRPLPHPPTGDEK